MLRGKIAFIQDDALWIIAPDGSGRRKLASSIVPSATFTPDLKHLVLTNGKPVFNYEGEDLFLCGLDGKHEVQLTHQGARFERPQFSPDGKHFACTRTDPPVGGLGTLYPPYDVVISSLDGREQKTLGDFREVKPSGSPVNRASQEGGAAAAQTTFRPGTRSFIAWSRDAREVLCWEGAGQVYGPPAREYILNLADSTERPFDGQWSRFLLPEVTRDGQRRAVFKYVNLKDGSISMEDAAAPYDGAQRLFIEETSGNQRILSLGKFNPPAGRSAVLRNPVWSPDSKRILFERKNDGEGKHNEEDALGTQLCIVNADGSGLKVLVQSHAASNAGQGAPFFFAQWLS